MSRKKRKQVILNTINSDPFLIRSCMNDLYKNKIYIISRSSKKNIVTHCRTKKQAEKYIKKNENLVYYDLSYKVKNILNTDLEYIVIFNYEFRSINDIELWYSYLKRNIGYICLTGVLRFARENCLDTNVYSYIEEAINDFELYDSFKIIDKYEKCN